MSQQSFNPVDYNFTWTDPQPGELYGWYEWDSAAAHKAALSARNAAKRKLTALGYQPQCSSSHSLVSRGGIGSGRPHVEFEVTVYRITY